MYRRQSKTSAALRRLLAFDAAWDLLLGVLLCAAPWLGRLVLGMDLAAWWPAFLIVGLASIAFGLLLARAAQGVNSVEICTAAAIANGVTAGVSMLAVSLIPFGNNATAVILLLVALVCAAFGFLEWRHVR